MIRTVLGLIAGIAVAAAVSERIVHMRRERQESTELELDIERFENEGGLVLPR